MTMKVLSILPNPEFIQWIDLLAFSSLYYQGQWKQINASYLSPPQLNVVYWTKRHIIRKISVYFELIDALVLSEPSIIQFHLHFQ